MAEQFETQVGTRGLTGNKKETETEHRSFFPKLGCKGKPSGRRREGRRPERGLCFCFSSFSRTGWRERGQLTGKGQEGMGTEMPAQVQSLKVGKRGMGRKEGL